MDRIGKKLLAGTCLPDEENRGFRGRHASEYLFGPLNAIRHPHHIIEAILGPVALVHQLVPQFMLAVLSIIESLENGKCADTVILP